MDKKLPSAVNIDPEKNGNSQSLAAPLRALQEKLRRSEELCSAFFESAAYGAARVAFADGTFLQVNQTLCEMTGYTEKELLQRTLFEITHPEDLDRTLEVLEKQSKTSSPTRQIEKRLVRKDGRSIWVHVAKQIIHSAENPPDYFAAVVIDISETKHSERQHADNFEALRLSQGVSMAGTFHWNVLTNQVTLSKSCHDLFGISVNDFKGTLEEWRARIHPLDLQKVEAEREEALSKKKQHFEAEYRAVLDDGSIKWIESRSRLYYDANGQFIRMAGIHMDVTARKQAEELLLRSEAEAKARADELAAILDAVPTMTFIAHDPDCKTMTSSRSAYEMLRLPHGSNTSKSAPESVRPQNFWIVKDGRQLSGNELPVQQAASTGKPIRNYEFVLAFNDGTSLDIFGHAVPLLDSTGAVRGAVGAFMDITERRRVEELTIKRDLQSRMLEREILAREHERRRIARELHDEAGQMLASLLAGLRSVETAKSFKVAKSQVKKLRSLTSRTIDGVGRLAQDLHPLVLDDLGLEIALRQYATEYSNLQGIPVRMKISGLKRQVLSDVVKLGIFRIVQEGLTNISKHARAKSVSISITIKSRHLALKIEDDGRGFVQLAAKADSRSHFGCQGMRERASMMHGSLKIDSQVGVGTTIFVTVPIPSSHDKKNRRSPSHEKKNN